MREMCLWTPPWHFRRQTVPWKVPRFTYLYVLLHILCKVSPACNKCRLIGGPPRKKYMSTVAA